MAIYDPLPAGKSAAVNALKLGAPADEPVAGPANIKFCVAVAAPVPPCATDTSALVVKIVALASGKVNTFSEVDGPMNLVNPLPVPPKAVPIICVKSAVPSKVLP